MVWVSAVAVLAKLCMVHKQMGLYWFKCSKGKTNYKNLVWFR
jgi:hypothetical protein